MSGKSKAVARIPDSAPAAVQHHIAELRLALTTAEGVPNVKRIIDATAFLAEAAKKAHLSLETVNEVQQIRLEAEIRLGHELRRMDIHPGGDRKSSSAPSRMILDDYGITWNLSSRSQFLAAHEAQVKALLPQILEQLSELSVLQLYADLRKLARQSAAAEVSEDDTCCVEDLAELASGGRKFGCIYADPPWRYENQVTRAAVSNHYRDMSVDEICELPVKDLAARDAHLHLWTTNAFLFEAPRIFDAWGFEFRSSFIWAKTNIGIGNYWRNSHEILLTAVRGDANHFLDHTLRSWIECNRSQHSSKPEQVRTMLRCASPAPYLELFARTPTEGWTAWGNAIKQNTFWQKSLA